MPSEESGRIVCDKCETEYSSERDDCPSCGSTMTRPDFVINSSYARDAPPLLVNVTEGFENTDPNRLQITMMKPGGDEDGVSWHTVSFTNPETFQLTLSSIAEIYNETEWDERSELLDDLSEDHEDRETVQQIVNQYPAFFTDVLDVVDFEDLGKEEIGFLMDTLGKLNQTVLQAEGRIQDSFLNLMEQLSDGDERTYNELADLLKEWHVLQVTSTSNVLMRRLQFLETFEEMIHSEEVYELRGEQSIHRSLENNLWLLDENHWLMQSNRSLRRFVQDEMEEELSDEDTAEALRRPDFVCATHTNHLVIAEIKRPSHTLNLDDVNQLQDYMYYASRYSGPGFDPVDGYLIGNSYDERAEHRAENSTEFEIRTYQDILDGARHRYQEYIDELERSEAPVPVSMFNPEEI